VDGNHNTVKFPWRFHYKAATNLKRNKKSAKPQSIFKTLNRTLIMMLTEKEKQYQPNGRKASRMDTI